MRIRFGVGRRPFLNSRGHWLSAFVTRNRPSPNEQRLLIQMPIRRWPVKRNPNKRQQVLLAVQITAGHQSIVRLYPLKKVRRIILLER